MKNLLVLFFALTFSITTSAQLNLKAGLNLANQSFESGGFSLSPGTKVGFFIGANYSAKMSESISLRPGAQFTLKGSEFDFLGSSFSASFNYIEIPVDLVYHTNKVSIHLGPYLGLLMSASTDGEDIKDEVKSTDFGLNFGLGYDVGAIGIGFNYGLGLSNINDDGTDGSIKNKVINLYVTFEL